MNNINECLLFTNMLANKQYSGAISPEEFNICAPVGQLNHLRVKIGLPELYSVQLRQAPQQLEASQILEDVLRDFMVSATIISTTGTFTIPTDFVAYRPSSYKYTFMEGGIAKSKRVPLEFVTSGEADLRNDNYVTQPSIAYPIINYEDGKLVVQPMGSIEEITLRYVKYPIDPKWNYTINANDQAVYNPVGSFNFAFPKEEWEMICERILKYWAIKFREEQLYSVADKAVNTGS